MNYNKVIFGGRLTRDVETKTLPSGAEIAELGLAASSTWKTKEGEKKEEVCFVDAVAFGRTAEVLAQYFKKGHRILVEGKLKYEQWEDKKGGGRRTRLKVQIESFQFVEKSDGAGGESPKSAKETATNDVPDDEIPF